MPRLPRVKAIEVIRALERLGFVQVRQKGSHIFLKKQVILGEGNEDVVNEVGCVVPLHRKTIAVGTLSSIVKQAGILSRRVYPKSEQVTHIPPTMAVCSTTTLSALVVRKLASKC